jgi:ABC-2 type transport system permease protein
VQLLFYLTPIVWPVDIILGVGGSGPKAGLAHVVGPLLLHLNPFYGLIQIVRGPLTRDGTVPDEWIAAGVLAVGGWALALIFMRNYRARVAYWV